MDSNAGYRCGSNEIDTQAGADDVLIMLACYYLESTDDVQLPDDWGIVKVKVVDLASQPLEATVTCRIDRFTRNPDYHTDPEGVATIFHPAGQLDQLRIYKYGYKSLVPKQPVEVIAGETRHVTFELASRPRMTGTVVGPDGLPVGGAIVVLLPTQFVMEADEFRVVTAGDGRFDFRWNYAMALWEAKSLTGLAGNRDELHIPIYLMAYHLRRNLSAIYEIDRPTYPDWELELLESPRLSGRYVGRTGDGEKATLHDMQIVWPYRRRNARSQSYQRLFTIESVVEENGRYDFTNGHYVDTDGDGYFDDVGLPALPPEFGYQITFQPKRGSRSEIFVSHEDLISGKTLQVNAIQ